MPHIEFLADKHEAGKTVAYVLRHRFRLTWTHAQRMVLSGHVRVAGFLVRDPAHRVKNRNRVWVREGTLEIPAGVTVPTLPGKAPRPRAKPAKPAPAERPVKPPKAAEPRPEAPTLSPDIIIYADDAVVVVNKPAGLTTVRHAEEAAEFGGRAQKFLPKTLADLLPLALGAPAAPLIAVHRLDRDTGGLVVLARTAEAADDLTEQFRKHTVERKYLALTRGAPADGRIESELVPDRGDGRRGSSVAGGGKKAVTRVKVLERFAASALVECRLETGRTHQVRIHLGEAGAPLCGETVYDRPPNGKPLPDGSAAGRPMLHAAALGFRHPASGEAMRWEAAPPADFARLLKKLRAEPKQAEAWDV